MNVGLLVLDCFIPESQSLKQKRSVLSSTIERLKRRYNVSACEFEHQDKWQHARLAVVLVNTDWGHAQGTLNSILEYLERDRRISVLDSQVERLL